MMTWLAHHGAACRLAVRRLTAVPLNTLLSVIAIGVALALPAGGQMLLSNVMQMARSASPSPQLSVFLRLDADRVRGLRYGDAVLPGPLQASRRDVAYRGLQPGGIPDRGLAQAPRPALRDPDRAAPHRGRNRGRSQRHHHFPAMVPALLGHGTVTQSLFGRRFTRAILGAGTRGCYERQMRLVRQIHGDEKAICGQHGHARVLPQVHRLAVAAGVLGPAQRLRSALGALAGGAANRPR